MSQEESGLGSGSRPSGGSPGGWQIPRIIQPDAPDKREKVMRELHGLEDRLGRLKASNEDLRKKENDLQRREDELERREKLIRSLEKNFGTGQSEGGEEAVIQSEDFDDWIAMLKGRLSELEDVVYQHKTKEKRLAEALADLGLQWVWDVVDDPDAHVN